MNVLIKGLKIPKSCGECDIAQRTKSGLRCPIASKQKGFSCTVSVGTIGLPHFCPLFKLPPHDRLGDLDVLFGFVESKYKVAKGEARKAYSDVLDLICAAGDIIEAEDGE